MAELPSEDIRYYFDEADATEYDAMLDAVWYRLVEAHSCIEVWRSFRRCPHEIVFPSSNLWMVLVEWALISHIIVVVTGALRDTKKHLSLKQLRKWMIEHVRPEAKAALRRYLDEEATVRVEGEICNRAYAIRDRLIAHQELARPKTITEDEIESLIRETGRLVNVLSIGSGRAMLPPEYLRDGVTFPAGSDTSLDVQSALDTLLRESNVLNDPERRPELWRGGARGMWLEHGELLNSERERLGMPRVDLTPPEGRRRQAAP